MDNFPGDYSLPNPVASAALTDPDRVIFKHKAIELTAIEVLSHVVEAAQKLASQGVVPGATVSLSGEPSVEWFICCHALGWLGATIAPLAAVGPRQPESEWLEQIDVFKPDFCLDLSGQSVPGVTTLEPGAICTSTIVRHLPTLLETERSWSLDEVRWQILSSGSYGKRRAISITTGQLYTSAMASAMRLGHLPTDTWLCCLPLNHVGGLSILARCAFYGTCVELHSTFDARVIGERLDSGEVNLVSLVPTMLQRILENRQSKPFPEALRTLLIGGAASDHGLLEKCRKIGAKIAVTWGMTESASQIATCRPGDLEAVLDCGEIGPPLAHSRVFAEPGSQRLIVSGPAVRGQFKTSDCGEVLDSGAVRIRGRLDDVIISGGENVSLTEIESVVECYPGIKEAAILAVKDGVWGQRLVAFVVLQPNQTQDQFEGWLKERLAAHKRPKQVIVLDSLPRSSLGKVQKSKLRQRIQSVGGR